MPLLIECDWTVEVQDEFRVGDAEKYTSFVLMLKATKLGGTSSEGRYYGTAKLHAESQSAWDDEEDGRPFAVIGGGRFAAPAVDHDVAFTLVAGDNRDPIVGRTDDGSTIIIVPLITADFSDRGMFTFITKRDCKYWANRPIMTRPSLLKVLPLGYDTRVLGPVVEVTIHNPINWVTEGYITGEFRGAVVGTPIE